MADNKGTDQQYLLNEQYKDASNLRTRIHLHRQYSVNTYGWPRWVFDYLHLSPKDARVLELGCGPCDLWLQNLNRIPDGWEIFLSDLSPGMIEKAQDLLYDRAQRFTFQEFDAQSIPHDDNSFDTIVANHMLYHLPDLDKGVREIQRVLKPAGKFYCATNGLTHLQELSTLREKFLQSIKDKAGAITAHEEREIGERNEAKQVARDSWRLVFSLENGEELLRSYFLRVTLRNYVDSLRVTSARALYEYMMSGPLYAVDSSLSTEYYNFLQAEMASAEGVITIAKETGMFQAWSEELPLAKSKHTFTFIEDDPNLELAQSPVNIDFDKVDEDIGGDEDDTTTKILNVK